MYQGTVVKMDVEGIGYPAQDWTEMWGSAGHLRNCVKMGMINGMPDDPDERNLNTYGLSGVEILAHEYSHRWLVDLNFDKDDGQGVRDVLRGWEDGPNFHWSARVNSHSVMYGGCITDLGGGQFQTGGCDRYYNQFELYAMGLMPPEEVEPLWYVDNGDEHGDASMPMNKEQSGTISGTRVDVAVDDVIRALGPRTPAYAEAQKQFRVAFLLATEAGVDATQAEIDKVESRWPCSSPCAAAGAEPRERGTST